MTLDYLRDPDAIYRRSFAMIREACDLSSLPEALLSAHARGQEGSWR